MSRIALLQYGVSKLIDFKLLLHGVVIYDYAVNVDWVKHVRKVSSIHRKWVPPLFVRVTLVHGGCISTNDKTTTCSINHNINWPLKR